MNEELHIDKNWTLFLDRDGVINEKRENDYVKNWGEFLFTNGALDAISRLSKIFGKIIVVTNQRGVGRELMTEEDLNLIHEQMITVVNKNFGRIDKIYYSIDIHEISIDRKPNVGMALKAKNDFPEIDFMKSIMAGDSMSDMEFGRKMGMLCVCIKNKNHTLVTNNNYDYSFESLFDFANAIKKRI